jgi:hypothetical protein
VTDLEQDFGHLVDLAFSLEQMTAPPRVKIRLVRGFGQAIGKAFCVGWLKTEEVDPAHSNPAVIRAAERGVRDYLP